MYLNLNDNSQTISQSQFITKLLNYFGNDFLKIDINDNTSLLGFRKYIPYKLGKIYGEADLTNNLIDILVKKIDEIKELTQPSDYDLSHFEREKSIELTSSTLLVLVSKLVSNGETTRKSLSISQTIQTHITNSFTPTTLGLAVKLNHRFGSREVISLLHEYGFLASYDEVLRFRS